MKINFVITVLFALITAVSAYSQNVGIGTATPNASAKLHIVDPNRGILIPNVALGNIATAAPVTTPATGLLVFNTNAAIVGGDGTGFYYWTGTQWLKLITTSIADVDFYEVGTTTAPNSITDNIYTQGNVAIGHTTPGVHTLVVASAGPAVKLGNSVGFNNLESGRLIFDENVPLYTGALGTYCGFEWNYDGIADLLSLNSGCTATGLIAAFTRGSRRVGIKTNAPTADLSVNGTADKTGGGTWAVFSDIRLKENISDYNEGLDLILKVRPINFSYNSKMRELRGNNESVNGKVFQGVIAQELQEIAPDMVSEVEINPIENAEDHSNDEENPQVERYLEVDPNKFTYALINAVQEQQIIIEEQGKELTELKNERANQQLEMEDLKKRLERLERQFGK